MRSARALPLLRRVGAAAATVRMERRPRAAGGGSAEEAARKRGTRMGEEGVGGAQRTARAPDHMTTSRRMGVMKIALAPAQGPRPHMHITA